MGRAIRRSSEKLAKSMLKRITTTFDESLHATPWMNNASASLAIEKLENMIFQVAKNRRHRHRPACVCGRAGTLFDRLDERFPTVRGARPTGYSYGPI